MYISFASILSHYYCTLDRKRLKKESVDASTANKTPKFSKGTYVNIYIYIYKCILTYIHTYIRTGFLSGSQLALINSVLEDATVTHLILMSNHTFIPITGK